MMSKEESKEVYQLFLERTGRASMIVTSNRDTAAWLSVRRRAARPSAVDRFKNSAYGFDIDGESHRPRLTPKLDDSGASPPPAARKPRPHPRSRKR